jgi:formylmethanofuran dehydrogenase subunit B
MSALADDIGSSGLDDATCLACGCLCDDIGVDVRGERIVDTRNTCELGRRWFQDHGEASQAGAQIAGRDATLDEAIAAAALMLVKARAPFIGGLTKTSIETQRLAVAVADECGAVLDPSDSAHALVRHLATQRIGKVSATLGEVSQRADVVMYVLCDPMRTHPRHWDRYAVAPSGRFLPNGRDDRKVVVLDRQVSETAKRANRFFRLEPEHALSSFSILRALLRGGTLDPARVLARTGVSLEQWHELLTLLTRAHYGAIFFNSGLAYAGSGAVEALIALTRDLNLRSTNRFVALTLGEAGNGAGIEAVLGWQAGVGCQVDFSRGFPRYLPFEASARIRSSLGAVDVSLIVGEAACHSPPCAPAIVIAPNATTLQPAAAIAINTSATGIEAGGTVMRCDGLMLPLRPALPQRAPNDGLVLKQLLAELILARHTQLHI